MARFVFFRLLGLVPTFAIIITASFFVIRLAEGSPFSSERTLPPEVEAHLRQSYGFDQSMAQQYSRYLSGLLRGDLGRSTRYPQRSVNEVITLGLPHTLALAVLALAWAVIAGIFAGAVSAMKHRSYADRVAMLGAMLGLSIPTFVLGPLLVLAVSLHLYWLPPSGWGSWRHLILPALTLGTMYAAYLARLARVGLLQVTASPCIQAARAKGTPAHLLLLRHVGPGGLLPTITFLGPATASLMVGSVVVEKIFNTPGIGPYLVDAAFNRDYFLVMGIVVLYSFLLLLMNLAVDVAHRFIDPRQRRA